MTVTAEPSLRRFTRREYYRMAEAGLFDRQHVELFSGNVITTPSQNHPNARTIMALNEWLVTALAPQGFTVRCQLPFVGSDTTELEPDFAVVAGSLRSQTGHPETALLVIEVADSSLRYDREKAAAYASSDVPEYWVINLADRQIEVCTQPRPAPDGEFAKRYEQRRVYGAADIVKPEGLPMAPVRVEELLPTL